MPTNTPEDQLVKYLTDAHSIEVQALAQMRDAPKIAGDPEIAAAFREHLTETERHERLVRERLEARGGTPSRFKKVVMEAGGKGFVLFARSQPDTPGKLVAHALSDEALEQASYELLRRVAHRAGDQATAEMAAEILRDEEAMAQRLEGLFDKAVDASLRGKSPSDLREQLVKYLADAHAIEQQAIQLLGRGPKLAGDPELAHLYEEHLGETKEHSRIWEQQLEALGGKPNKLKDAAMRLGALNWGGFFQAHPDTPGKLAAFAYAFEHLEIGGFEELKRVAQRAGEQETAAAAERILAEERAAAGKLRAQFDRACEASLEAVGAAG
jgi:ferritin-like metal-binding protein YciE